jgi:hypothetical protein
MDYLQQSVTYPHNVFVIKQYIPRAISYKYNFSRFIIISKVLSIAFVIKNEIMHDQTILVFFQVFP